MKYLQESWYYFIIEPFKWIFAAFFQPLKFARANERKSILQRIIPTIWLAFPLFLTYYVFMLFTRLIRTILFSSNLIFTYNPFPIDKFFIPAQSIVWSYGLGLLFILIGGIRFGITFGIGTSIAFTTLSTFMRSFDLSKTISYPFPYSSLATLLTGFVIGILFAVAFFNIDDARVTNNGHFTPVETGRGIIRGIGFGIALIIILHHLENVDLQGLVNSINDYSNFSGLIGCIAVGVALSVAGDIVIESKADSTKSIEGMIVKGVTAGVIFGITFAFILILIPLFDPSSRMASDIDNLSMVSILLGLVGGFLAGMSGIIMRRVILAIGIIAVVAILGNSSLNYPIFNIPVLSELSSSPFSFVYYGILNLALGLVGGDISSNKLWNEETAANNERNGAIVDDQISSNKSWNILFVICFIIVLLELINYFVGGLAYIFAVTFELSIVSGISSGMVTGMISGFLKNIDKGLARGFAFTIALVIASSSLNFVNFNAGNYTIFQTALVIGLGCIAGYVLVYSRLPSYPLAVLSMRKTHNDSQKNPTQVFRNLHNSALYWDETAYFSLPYLEQILHIAVEQDEREALEVATFIKQERPRQVNAAQITVEEIALRDLERQDRLSSIASGSQYLSKISQSPVELPLPFDILNKTSQYAHSFNNSSERQDKKKALEDMEGKLNEIDFETAFADDELNKRLRSVVTTWLEIVRREQTRLD